MCQLSLFGKTSNEEVIEISSVLTEKEFKEIWKKGISKEKSNVFQNENPKNISKDVQGFLKEHSIPVNINHGLRRGVQHDFLTVPAIDGEIIIDCKNRKFNQFEKRLKLVKPNDSVYNEYVVLKKS